MQAGTRWVAAGSTTEVVIVRAPRADERFQCAGLDMVPASSGPNAAPEVVIESTTNVEVGKRYADEESGLEVLCAKRGPGPLVFKGRPLTVKGAKPLPSSD